jgi:hypothetical protein
LHCERSVAHTDGDSDEKSEQQFRSFQSVHLFSHPRALLFWEANNVYKTGRAASKARKGFESRAFIF